VFIEWKSITVTTRSGGVRENPVAEPEPTTPELG